MRSRSPTRAVLRLGIVGCGYGAEQLHLPALRAVPSVRAVALAEPDAGRLERVGSRFAIERRYRDHEALLGDTEVDAVLVCAPPAAHAAIAEAALEAKKHVLVEKPLCLDLDQADRLVEHAGRASVTSMVGFNLRYQRHVRAAKEAIAGGSLGTVELVRTVWSSQVLQQPGLPAWRHRRESGGGVLNEMAVHHIDLWRFLLGTEVEQVFACSRSETNDDQSGAVTGRLQNGALAVSGFSQRAAEAHEIEIYGRKGRLLVSPYRFDGLELAPASRFPGDLASRAGGVWRAARALPAMVRSLRSGGAFLESYRAEWEHFADRTLRGKPADSTFEDGRRALEVVQAAIESVRSGQPVDVGQVRRLRRDVERE